MNAPLQEPGRKQLPHLPSWEFTNQTIIQYLTCNMAGRRPLLANPGIHQLILEAWSKADHWMVGRYVFMPDHVHLFCAPIKIPVTPLKQWVEFWRGCIAPLVLCGGETNLAKGFFRPATSQRRKLSSEMALCFGKSGQSWFGCAVGRLAVSRRIERSSMA